MRLLQLAPVLVALLFVPACGGEADAAGNPTGIATELTKVLTGVTDATTAEAAKDQVTSLTDQLGKAVESMKAAGSDATDKAEGAADNVGKMAGDMAKKAAGAISPELTKAFLGISQQISRLMGDEKIKSVLGPTLEKLKGLIPG